LLLLVFLVKKDIKQRPIQFRKYLNASHIHTFSEAQHHWCFSVANSLLSSRNSYHMVSIENFAKWITERVALCGFLTTYY